MSYSQILPTLYIGNQYSSSVLQPLGAVVSIGCNNKSTLPGLQTLKISISDSSESDITPFLDEVTEFINSLVSDDIVVLVHCKGGINRSPAVIVAYLVRFCGFSMEEALMHVKNKRKGARFQPHYLEQIEAWLESRANSEYVPIGG